jgi:hypothetical protein
MYIHGTYMATTEMEARVAILKTKQNQETRKLRPVVHHETGDRCTKRMYEILRKNVSGMPMKISGPYRQPKTLDPLTGSST